MIRYDLVCGQGHRFDAWFRDSGAFEDQAGSGALACPSCADAAIVKAPMAPNVASRRDQAVLAPGTRERAFRSFLRELRDKAVENSDYVGARFPEEARRIHYQETEQRGVHGEASLEEARSLIEEGISVMPLPDVPEERN